MARVIRKHWKLLLLQAVFLGAVAGLIVWGTAHSSPSIAQSPPPESNEMDVATYTAVSRLRQELALTNADLAAMGCSQEDTQRLLSALVQWCETNKTTLKTKEVAIRQGRNQLRQLHRQINVGPRNERVIAEVQDLYAQLAQQVGDRRSFVEGAKAAVHAVATADQRSIHQAALANRGMPNRMRYVPDLTGEQVKAIRQAMSRRTTDSAAITSTIDQTLNLLQRSASDQALTNQRRNMPGVLAAEKNILPTPSESIDLDQIP